VDIERYLAELSAWRSWNEASAASRAEASSMPVAWPRENDRWKDRAHSLVAYEAVATAARELERAGDLRSLRALELVAVAAAAHRCAEVAGDADRIRAEPLVVGAGAYTFDEVEVWLAAESDPNAREAARDTLDAASERVGAAAAATADCMRSAALDTGLRGAWELWSLARDRDLDRVAGWAAGIIEHAAESVALVTDSPLAARQHWSELPALIAGPREGITLPCPDAVLLDFVAASLALDRLAAERIGLDLGSRPGKPARDIVRREVGGRRVLAARRPLGVLRDYRGTLRLLGCALSTAANERSPDAAGDFADPGLQGLYGALFESQVLRPAWQERAFGRAAPGALCAAWQRQSVARTLRLAGETRVALSGGGHPALPALGTALAGRLPLGPQSSVAPWSSAAGEAADELAGRLLAPELDDVLARRFGSAWSLSSRAGTFLRDLWATPHPSLDALSSDLGLDGPGVTPVLDTWKSAAT
jgi:hypothetical protein